jgi:hypothetical protein
MFQFERAEIKASLSVAFNTWYGLHQPTMASTASPGGSRHLVVAAQVEIVSKV